MPRALRFRLAVAALALAVASPGETGRTGAEELGARELRKRMEEMAQPRAEHELLAPLVGRFRFRAYVRLSPDDNPESAHGVAEARWILGRRFVQQEIRGRRATRSFEGRLILGFDNYAERYVGSWLDENDSGITTISAPRSEDGRTLRLTVELNDPRFEGRRRREGELLIEDETTFVLRFFEAEPSTGARVAMAEIRFERVDER
jgi:hypothetical protein